MVGALVTLAVVIYLVVGYLVAFVRAMLALKYRKNEKDFAYIVRRYMWYDEIEAIMIIVGWPFMLAAYGVAWIFTWIEGKVTQWYSSR